MEVGREAVAILESEPPGRELALAYANLSHLHQHLEDGGETIAWANRAIELGDLEAEVYALTNIANAAMLAGRSGKPRARASARARARRGPGRARRTRAGRRPSGGLLGGAGTAMRSAASSARWSSAPSGGWSCGGCSRSRSGRACSSTAATGATRPTPRASFSAIPAARRCRGSSRCLWPGSCARGAVTRKPGRCSTRRGRSPSRAASCSGSSRPRRRGRRPPGSRAERTKSRR